MRAMKRIASVVLAMVMVLAMAVPVLADPDVEYKITIENPLPETTYTAYKVLDLVNYDKSNPDKILALYSVAEGWAEFFTAPGAGAEYIEKVPGVGDYVTWKGETTTARVEVFSQAALKYANEHQLVVKSKTITTGKLSEGETKLPSIDIDLDGDGLGAGYYLVDSGAGAVVSLDTTVPTAEIKEKNEAPSSEKTVEEDSTGIYGEKDNADVGQTVNFRATIEVKAGAQNYIFHDKMDNGLEFDPASVKVLINGQESGEDDGVYTVKSSGLADECTFEIEFKNNYIGILVGSTITIEYSAKLTEAAINKVDGVLNTERLSYGDENDVHYTPDSTTKTYTYNLSVYKYIGNSDDPSDTSKPLAGAKFVLSKGSGADEVFAVFNSNGVFVDWLKKDSDGNYPEGSVLETNANGKIDMKGLDADTYTLTETEAPAGYNKADPIVVTIGDDGTASGDGVTDNTVNVANYAGAELPSTGGMGTTIFYVVGAILILGAGILLVTNKRMSK